MIKEETMREAGAVLRSIFVGVIPLLVPGEALATVDAYVAQCLSDTGSRSALRMMGFPGYMSFAVNEQVIQGAASGRILAPGDLVSIDMTLYYKGFFVDKAQTVVLDPQHYIKRYLVSAVEQCFNTAFNNLRAGYTAGAVGSLIEAQAMALRVKPGKDFYGHGIGESHHMKPLIPNFNNQSGDLLREGDFITLEPIIFYDHYWLTKSAFEVKANVLSAHMEETIMILKDGAEVIT